MKRFYLNIIISLSTILSLNAENTSNIVGVAYNAVDSTFIDGAHICLIQNNKVKYDVPMATDCAFIRDVVHGKYTLEIDALGYELYRDTVSVSDFKVINAYLKPQSAIVLNELKVEGSRSDIVTNTAYGQLFYLSEKARKLKNPFYALMEIPALIVNPSLSSVTNINGISPLILINGERINSGINPLDPSEIESVEIINNVPARYINEGIRSIINITVKKKESPYIWYELATRHEFPLYYGFGVGYFEIGNPKYSLYGRASADYTYNHDFEKSTYRIDKDYEQYFNSTLRSNRRGWLGELLFKANPSDNDYLALHGYAKTNLLKNIGSGKGYLNDTPYSFFINSRSRSIIATSSAYYKRILGKNKTFEARLAYNYNKNNLENSRTDQYSDSDFDTEYNDISVMNNMRNTRHSGTLHLDLFHIYNSNDTYGFGAHTSMTFDRLHQVTEPQSIYQNRNISQYIYAEWGGKLWDKLWVLPSAGVNAMWLKQGNFSKNYFLPRIKLGLSWNFDTYNRLSIDYELTNDAPEIKQLNPINTSTDPLYKIIGNPHLKPQTMHFIPIEYVYVKKKWYISAYAYYKRINDMLSQDGYIDSNGAFVSTYGNAEYLTQTLARVMARYRIGIGSFSLSAGWYANHFSGQTYNKHNAFFIRPQFNITLKKFLILGDLYFQTTEINKISRDKFFKPWKAELQVNYNITENFYVGLCLQNFTGTYRVRTITDSGSFHEIVDTKNKYMSPRPFVIIRYSFRKNAKRKIKLDKVLDSHEKGIIL